jgi:hypothetical protein
LQKHKREKHPLGGELAVWLCQICGVPCQNTTNLWKHMVKKHGSSEDDAKKAAKDSKRFLRAPKGKLNPYKFIL